MLTEVLVVGLLVYLQFQDASVGLWSMSAAVISLIGEDIAKRSHALISFVYNLDFLHDSFFNSPKLFYKYLKLARY